MKSTEVIRILNTIILGEGNIPDWYTPRYASWHNVSDFYLQKNCHSNDKMLAILILCYYDTDIDLFRYTIGIVYVTIIMLSSSNILCTLCSRGRCCANYPYR